MVRSWRKWSRRVRCRGWRVIQKISDSLTSHKFYRALPPSAVGSTPPKNPPLYPHSPNPLPHWPQQLLPTPSQLLLFLQPLVPLCYLVTSSPPPTANRRVSSKLLHIWSRQQKLCVAQETSCARDGLKRKWKRIEMARKRPKTYENITNQ